MKREINITIWGVPVTVNISDDIIKWIYGADSFETYKHRVYLLMQYIISRKLFKFKR